MSTTLSNKCHQGYAKIRDLHIALSIATPRAMVLNQNDICAHDRIRKPIGVDDRLRRRLNDLGLVLEHP